MNINKIILCPHCGGPINITNISLTPEIPDFWCEVKISDDENIVYICDECKKEVKEGYIKHPIEYSNYSAYSKHLMYSQLKPYFYCKCCARKNGVEQQYLFDNNLRNYDS